MPQKIYQTYSDLGLSGIEWQEACFATEIQEFNSWIKEKPRSIFLFKVWDLFFQGKVSNANRFILSFNEIQFKELIGNVSNNWPEFYSLRDKIQNLTGWDEEESKRYIFGLINRKGFKYCGSRYDKIQQFGLDLRQIYYPNM